MVWGAEADTLTAVDEIRQRCADATAGVPHETRQPLADGSTSFERILPGPERMYPDTDSPPQRLSRERVEALRLTLPEPPWEREARYRAAGVPESTVHFLIRRGGARLVDRVVERCGADLKRACFFFGEELKGLRRAGIAVDAVSEESWCSWFRRVAARPVLWQARQQVVKRLSADPGADVERLTAGFEREPQDWPERWSTAARRRCLSDRAARRPAGRGAGLRRLAGQAMAELRGKVCARRVIAVLEAAWEEG